LKPVTVPAPVQKYQRLAGAPCEQHDVGAVDPNLLPFEAGRNLRRLCRDGCHYFAPIAES